MHDPGPRSRETHVRNRGLVGEHAAGVVVAAVGPQGQVLELGLVEGDEGGEEFELVRLGAGGGVRVGEFERGEVRYICRGFGEEGGEIEEMGERGVEG